jgi:hypothetical protein
MASVQAASGIATLVCVQPARFTFALRSRLKTQWRIKAMKERKRDQYFEIAAQHSLGLRLIALLEERNLSWPR